MNAVVAFQGTEVATAAQVVAHTLRVQEIMKAVMQPEIHYGVIPGTTKNTLYKPGAELLCMSFHIAPSYAVDEARDGEDVRYRVTCRGVHQGSGITLAEGMGSCSSLEEKYKWRKTYNKKEWEAAPPDRRRVDFGYNKKERREYEILQVRTETADIENTLLKMACKRALIAMVLNAVAASDIFAQDLDNLSSKVRDMMVDDEGAGAHEDEREPVRSKSGNGNGHAAPASAPSDSAPVPAPDSMKRLIASKAASPEIMATLLAKHNVKLDDLTVAQGNAILAELRGA